jgi:hypothetical protein
MKANRPLTPASSGDVIGRLKLALAVGGLALVLSGCASEKTTGTASAALPSAAYKDPVPPTIPSPNTNPTMVPSGGEVFSPASQLNIGGPTVIKN